MSHQDSAAIAATAFALGHKRRIDIFRLLHERPETGATLGALEIASGLARGSLIHHLRTLERSGLVRRRTKGSATEYRANAAPLSAHASVVDLMARDPAFRSAKRAA